jgi:alpha-methylacyl-CoA racemase
VSGPLAGVRVLEIASIGPGPFAAMVLADLGATVVRIERPGSVRGVSGDPLLRGRAAVVAIDLKDSAGAELAGRLVDGSDVLIEGFRPGVAERLGIGPVECLGRNPRLVYGRITGWGQEGPRSQEAGHDIDYIALAGALQPIGPPDAPPPPPLNLVADFGGGGMLLVVGILAALTERSRSGAGQVVDAAMVDGSALLMAMHHGLAAAGLWSDARGDNVLDGAAPFYRCYRTADDRFMAVGALEPEFYAALLAGLGLDPTTLPAQYERKGWEATGRRIAEVFATRTRDEWTQHFSGTDACVAPVLTPLEAPRDSHLIARETFVPVGGVLQPAPAPRFGRTPGLIRGNLDDPAVVLAGFGLNTTEVSALGNQ